MKMKMLLDFRVRPVKWTAVFTRRFFLAAVLLLSASCSGFVQASTLKPVVLGSPTAEISAPSIFFKEGCHFGGAVDIEGDLLVVGAPCWGRPPGEGAGGAYVLRKTAKGDLVQEAVLTASDREDGFQYDQHFGMSVVFMDETTIAVGVPGYDDPQVGDNTGAIFIFEYNGSDWVETGKLISSQPKPGAKIGTILSCDGNLLAASGSPEAGMVVSFERTGAGGWGELAQAPLHSPAQGDPYTVHIDLYGTTLAISTVEMATSQDNLDQQAYLHSLKTTGIVTLYERVGNEWQQTYQTAPQEASLFRMDESAFGLPVALGGEAGRATWLAVGKPGFAGSGRETGSVAIFERGNHDWKTQAELSLAPGEPVPGALTFFGHDPGPIFFGVFVEIEGQPAGSRLDLRQHDLCLRTSGSKLEIPVRGSSRSRPMGRLAMTSSADVAMNGDNLLMGSPGELAGGEVYLFNLQQ